MPDLSDEAKNEIRQFMKAERTEQVELREKRANTTIKFVLAFGVFTLTAAGTGLYFLIDSIAGQRADAAIEERLTQEAIINRQSEALDKIVSARVTSGNAEQKIEDLLLRADILLGKIRAFSENTQDAQVKLSLLEPLLKAGGDLEAIATSDEFIARVRGSTVPTPPGMVAAFVNDAPLDDASKHCPAGWSSYREARGRVIIGAGPKEGNLSEHPPLETGGEETVTLTEVQMPTHFHVLKWGHKHSISLNRIRDNPDVPDDNQYLLNWGGEHNLGRADNSMTATWAGGNQPHNNMPPYIALYFCKKD